MSGIDAPFGEGPYVGPAPLVPAIHRRCFCEPRPVEPRCSDDFRAAVGWVPKLAFFCNLLRVAFAPGPLCLQRPGAASPPRGQRRRAPASSRTPPQAGLDIRLDRLELLGRQRDELQTEDVILGRLAVVADDAFGLEGASAPERDDQLDLVVDVAALEAVRDANTETATADVARMQDIQEAVAHDVDADRRRGIGLHPDMPA